MYYLSLASYSIRHISGIISGCIKRFLLLYSVYTTILYSILVWITRNRLYPFRHWNNVLVCSFMQWCVKSDYCTGGAEVRNQYCSKIQKCCSKKSIHTSQAAPHFWNLYSLSTIQSFMNNKQETHHK